MRAAGGAAAEPANQAWVLELLFLAGSEQYPLPLLRVIADSPHQESEKLGRLVLTVLVGLR